MTYTLVPLGETEREVRQSSERKRTLVSHPGCLSQICVKTHMKIFLAYMLRSRAAFWAFGHSALPKTRQKRIQFRHTPRKIGRTEYLRPAARELKKAEIA